MDTHAIVTLPTHKTLTGRVPAEAILVYEIPRLPVDLLAAFRALEDLSSAVSDAMDSLGLFGAVAASPPFALQM